MTPRPPLREIVRHPEFASRSLGLALRVPHATDASEVSAVLAEAATVLGADAAAFASFMKDDPDYSSYRFVLACDPTWCFEYEQGACYMHDPWLDYVRQHGEPVAAERIPARTALEREVVELARRYGFASALIVPALAPQGLTRLGALCLGSSESGYFDDEALPVVANAAMPLAVRLHDWLVTELRREWLESHRLTDDELLLLREERAGRRSKHVAALLNISAPSVDSRWQRLNAKLGVPNRQVAATLAAEYGLI